MSKYTLPPEHHFFDGRVCKKCQEFKPQDAFQIAADKKAKFGLTLTATCKSCAQLDNWKTEIRYRYGMTVEDYEALENAQNKKCAICGSESTNNSRAGKRLFVDHCHTTDKIRGLLCSTCNHGLGQFKDSVEVLQSAIDYLKSFEKEIQNGNC